MDNIPHPLATESFSYSWLASTPKSFSESQHKTISNNDQSLVLDETNQNFDFNISISQSYHSSLVHADKLFSNGLILPRSLDKPSDNNAACSSIIASSSSSSSSSSTPPMLLNSKIRHSSSFRRIVLGKWSRFVPGKIVSKYIKCLVPMKRSFGKSGTRVDDVNRLTWEVNTSNNTSEVASPRKEFAAYSSSCWTDIDESSISEAILYCKRSSGLCLD